MDAQWGPMNPNTDHQMWSRWTFRIFGSKVMAITELEHNFGRWCRMGFGSVGRARVKTMLGGYVLEIETEGAPADDPKYLASVEQQFRSKFLAQGFGDFAFGDVTVKTLAGKWEDGKPREQLLVMPGRLDTWGN